MKKVLSFILVVVLLITALTACSRKKVDLSAMTSLAEINGSGAYIGAQSGTFHIDALRAQSSGVTVKEYDSFTLLLTALNSGAIDGYVAEEPTAWAVEAKDSTLSHISLVNNDTGFKASDDEAGVAVAFKTGSDLVSKVNVILALLPTEVRSALMKEMVSIAEDPDTQKTLSLLDFPSLPKTNGTLKIAMECDYQPYNWTQTTEANGAVKIANSQGYANGYDVQIAKFIAASLGMELEVYAYKWESLIAGVQAGTVDGIIAGMSPTAEREIEVDFTNCYWTSNLVVIYKK